MIVKLYLKKITLCNSRSIRTWTIYNENKCFLLLFIIISDLERKEKLKSFLSP